MFREPGGSCLCLGAGIPGGGGGSGGGGGNGAGRFRRRDKTGLRVLGGREKAGSDSWARPLRLPDKPRDRLFVLCFLLYFFFLSSQSSGWSSAYYPSLGAAVSCCLLGGLADPANGRHRVTSARAANLRAPRMQPSERRPVLPLGVQVAEILVTVRTTNIQEGSKEGGRGEVGRPF